MLQRHRHWYSNSRDPINTYFLQTNLLSVIVFVEIYICDVTSYYYLLATLLECVSLTNHRCVDCMIFHINSDLGVYWIPSKIQIHCIRMESYANHWITESLNHIQLKFDLDLRLTIYIHSIYLEFIIIIIITIILYIQRIVYVVWSLFKRWE